MRFYFNYITFVSIDNSFLKLKYLPRKGKVGGLSSSSLQLYPKDGSWLVFDFRNDTTLLLPLTAFSFSLINRLAPPDSLIFLI